MLGGYDTKLVKFHPQDKEGGEPILALVYIATPQNPSYLGPASEEDIAAQIIVSSGRSGHNIEYLLRLADFMRYCCPQVEDEHLFSIEEALISVLPCLYHGEETIVEEWRRLCLLEGLREDFHQGQKMHLFNASSQISRIGGWSSEKDKFPDAF